MKKCIILILLLLFPFSVKADDACSYATRSELNKEASKVKASYEFINDELNNAIGFKISVYNISDKLTLTYTIDGNTREEVVVDSSQISQDGIYTFDEYNLSTAITYNFNIKGNYNSCFNSVRTIKLTKPIKNEYHSMAICRNQYLPDNYYYCREWINTEITLSYLDVVKKINDEIARNTPSTTTKCASCVIQEKKEEVQSDFLRIKIYIIIGLSIGIILDSIVLILSIKRARDDIF